MRKISLKIVLLPAVLAMSFEMAQAQAQTTQTDKQLRSLRPAGFNLFWSQAKTSRIGFPLMPAGAYANTRHPRFIIAAAAANPVIGSGTPGQIAKWSGVFGTNTFTLGNSAITEDKFGKIGIGTITPTSPLTVAGIIETINPGGGIKFADGTIQTTSATGALFSITHDATLTGNGTAALPLGVAVPLILSGTPLAPMISVSNLSPGRSGLESFGGNSIGSPGGRGVQAFGGNGTTGGGDGIFTVGGNSDATNGGSGVSASGGDTVTGSGGHGVGGFGGSAISGGGGVGMLASGGDSDSGVGGDGIFVSRGHGPLGDGLAGHFFGDVNVTGTLSKGGGSFKIDHPLDPENRYLYHSFVESPDMKNIYDGNVVTDENGEATVELPDYFEALNRDFRYQLTVVGTFAQAIVGEEIKGNRFFIRTNAPNVKVSWQVTGIRQDAWANKNRIKVDVKKTERERGHYLHPEAFDQPEELGIQSLRHPELMTQRKNVREQVRPKQQ